MQQFAAAVTACMPRQSSAACGFLVKALMPACWLAVAAGVFAQSTAPAGTAQAPANPVSSGPSNQAAPAQQVPRVTTTVVVHGEVKDDYLPETVTVGTLEGAALKDTPLSATVMTRDLLTDQVSRLLSDVVKNDASIGDDYVPVGYYGDYRFAAFPSIWPLDSRSTA